MSSDSEKCRAATPGGRTCVRERRHLGPHKSPRGVEWSMCGALWRGGRCTLVYGHRSAGHETEVKS